MGLIRNHYVGRTFIQPQQSIRHFGVKVKLNPVRSILDGKRVILVDDSIVRGTTSRKIVRMVRAAGAKEVHVRISCPPTISPCFYGVDTPRKSELIAATHTLDEIREFLEADSVALPESRRPAERGRIASAARTAARATPVIYPVAFPRDEASYLQLALKLDTTRTNRSAGNDHDKDTRRTRGHEADAAQRCGLVPFVSFVSLVSSVLRAAVAARAGTGGAAGGLAPLSSRPRSTSSATSTTPRAPNASRTVRRTPAAQAVPALLQAVAEHADGYVRYRALVLLTGFNDPRTKDAMRESLDQPQRSAAHRRLQLLRAQSRSRRCVPQFLTALDKEQARVRPAGARARAGGARGAGRRRRRARPPGAVARGRARRGFLPQRRHRGARRLQGAYALDAITAIAKLDGPLQDDAALALGKIGDKRALETLAALQRTAPRQTQPSIAAAICLLGINCESHENYLIDTLKFSDKNLGFQELLRGAAAGLGALAVAGPREAADALFEIGIPSRRSDARAGRAGARRPSRCAIRR